MSYGDKTEQIYCFFSYNVKPARLTRYLSFTDSLQCRRILEERALNIPSRAGASGKTDKGMGVSLTFFLFLIQTAVHQKRLHCALYIGEGRFFSHSAIRRIFSSQRFCKLKPDGETFPPKLLRMVCQMTCTDFMEVFKPRYHRQPFDNFVRHLFSLLRYSVIPLLILVSSFSLQRLIPSVLIFKEIYLLLRSASFHSDASAT